MEAGRFDRYNLLILIPNLEPGQIADSEKLQVVIEQIFDQVDVNWDDYAAHKGKDVLDHPDGSVTTPKLANFSVTRDKISNGAINAVKISNGTITLTQVDISSFDSRYYTESEVDTMIIDLRNRASSLETRMTNAETNITNDKNALTTHKLSGDHDGRYYTKSQIDTHTSNMSMHLSSADRAKFNGIQAGAEVNQNAFTKVNDILASSKEDTLNITGGLGITVSTDPITKKVTVTATGETAPGPHASTHGVGGADPLTPEMIGAETPAGAQAKADSAEEAAKAWARALGFGEDGEIYNGDINSLETNGNYYSNSEINSPYAGNWFFYRVMVNNESNPTYAIQEAYTWNNKLEVFIRRKFAGTWQDWERIPLESDVIKNTGGTIDGTLKLNGQLLFENGHHWITYNDGGGNFNVRIGHKFENGKNVYTAPGHGAIHMAFTHETHNPSLGFLIGENPTGKKAGDEVTFSKRLTMNSQGLFQWDGNSVWHAGQLRWNNGTLEYNDNGTWKAVGGMPRLVASNTVRESNLTQYSVSDPSSRVLIMKYLPKGTGEVVIKFDIKGTNWATVKALSGIVNTEGSFLSNKSDNDIDWRTPIGTVIPSSTSNHIITIADNIQGINPTSFITVEKVINVVAMAPIYILMHGADPSGTVATIKNFKLLYDEITN